MTVFAQETPCEPPAQSDQWRSATRVGFRFLLSLSVLCLLTRLVIAHAEGDAEFNPAAALIRDLCARFWAPVIVWTGRSVLGVQRHLAYEPGGNSDGIYGHVQWLVIAVLAAVSVVVWTLASRGPVSYQRQLDWLRVALRYGLGFKMLTYGMVKVLGVQFTFPDLNVLRVPYGEFRPMTVLWTCMGYSSSYTCFAGAVEILGALLLFFRRTTTLGALITGGALVNVFMLDISYDVPEKLDVLWMLAATFVLLYPNMRRLTNVLLLNRTVPAAALVPPDQGPWTARLGAAAKLLVIGYGVIPITIMAPKYRAEHNARSPLCGVYNVEEFTLDGRVLPPLTTDTERWAEVVFTTPAETMIKLMDGSWHFKATEVDPAGAKLTLSTPDGKEKNVFECSGAGTEQLTLRGSWAGAPITAILKRFDETTLPLIQKNRRWINGFP